MYYILTISITLVLVFIYEGQCVIIDSQKWSVIYENKGCRLRDPYRTEVDVEYVTDCARLCGGAPECTVFEYDWPNQICKLFTKSFPRQLASNPCSSGDKVYSYRKYQEGCTGLGYIYDRHINICISYPVDYQQKFWHTGKAICESNGEELISIDTLDKLALCQDVIKHSYKSALYYYFVGGTRANGSMPFMWLNGNPIDPSLDYWEHGPNFHLLTSHCVYLNNIYSGLSVKLEATGCLIQVALYLCSKPVSGHV